MISLHYKIKRERNYDAIYYDMFYSLIAFILFIIILAAVECTCGKGDLVVAIAVGLIGVGIIIANVSAVVRRWFDYMEEKKKIEAECFKYEVKESLKYGRYRGKWVFEQASMEEDE